MSIAESINRTLSVRMHVKHSQKKGFLINGEYISANLHVSVFCCILYFTTKIKNMTISFLK